MSSVVKTSQTDRRGNMAKIHYNCQADPIGETFNDPPALTYI